MSRIKRARPALVVVVLALIAGVAGTALAEPTATTSKPAKKIAQDAKKKAKKALNKAKANATLLDELCGPGASAAGSETCTAPQGPKGDPGTNGTNGADGADGTAVAYARVTPSSAGVQEALSQNVADSNVTVRQDIGNADLPGQVCFHDLTFTPRSVQATVEIATLAGRNAADMANADRIANAFVFSGPLGCPLNTTAVVFIHDASSGVGVNEDRRARRACSTGLACGI